MLRYPVNYIGITQAYTTTHPGIDFGWKNDKYMPIYSADDGIVLWENYYSNKEIACVIYHPHLKMVTHYGHLSKSIVSEGEEVKQGQQIGNMGNTGNSKGNHLHFEVWANIPDGFKHSESTLKANRAKYKIDPLTVTYVTEDQTLSSGNKYNILKMPNGNELVQSLQREIETLTKESLSKDKSISDLTKESLEKDKIIASKNDILNKIKGLVNN